MKQTDKWNEEREKKWNKLDGSGKNKRPFYTTQRYASLNCSQEPFSLFDVKRERERKKERGREREREREADF